ncbi:hypothetical protein CSAL01_02302 [Colletotrichum salicis]|uniref:Uncharacterized protein n=1 Tax=Colletotrichum salicis TaxID=1209931 RepID=A0A135V2S9_9PEZI|nr:hypothetical protein CSAL01_02302 [Colletotrichum salicis]
MEASTDESRKQNDFNYMKFWGTPDEGSWVELLEADSSSFEDTHSLLIRDTSSQQLGYHQHTLRIRILRHLSGHAGEVIGQQESQHGSSAGTGSQLAVPRQIKREGLSHGVMDDVVSCTTVRSASSQSWFKHIGHRRMVLPRKGLHEGQLFLMPLLSSHVFLLRRCARLRAGRSPLRVPVEGGRILFDVSEKNKLFRLGHFGGAASELMRGFGGRPARLGASLATALFEEHGSIPVTDRCQA